MKAKKKAKLVGHTTWPIQQAQQFQPPQPIFNPPFQTIPTFGYNPYPINWQPSQPNHPKLSPYPQLKQLKKSCPHLRQAPHSSRKTKLTKMTSLQHYQPSA